MEKFKNCMKNIIKVILVFFLISFVLFEGVRYKVAEKVFVFVMDPIVKPLLDEMLQESAERKARIANGEDVEMITGWDTFYEKDNLYYMSKVGLSNTKIFEIYENKSLQTILDRVEDYSVKKDGYVYIISYEGYAIIDDKNQCRVYITVPMDKFVEKKEYEISPEGERRFYSRRLK